MTKQEFIDKLFEECEDALIDGDIDVVLDYFEKHYLEAGPDFEKIFINVISNIMDKSDLEKYKQKFGYFLYMYLASHFGIQDIYIPEFKEKYKFNSHYWHDKDFKFKTVTLEDRVSSASDFECEELIVNGNGEKGRTLSLSCKATTITYNTYVESTRIDWCKNIYFDEKAVAYEGGVPIVMRDFNCNDSSAVEKVILPPVDGVQIPRWMCSKLNKDKTMIYKQVGQKISIFSVYKEWLKEHVKSV